MFTRQAIEEIAREYIKELEAIGREFYGIKVVTKSRKSVTGFGRAIFTHKSKGYDTMEINQYIENESDLRNTILHELAHLDKEARLDKHGPKWKRVAALYGKKYGVNITRTSNKSVKVPGQVSVNIVWTEKCLQMNPQLRKYKPYTRNYTSKAYAKRFIDKYMNMGFIKEYEYI